MESKAMHLEEFRIGTLDDFIKNGRKAQKRGEHACNCFMLMCGRIYHNIVKQLSSNKIFNATNERLISKI